MLISCCVWTTNTTSTEIGRGGSQMEWDGSQHGGNWLTNWLFTAQDVSTGNWWFACDVIETFSPDFCNQMKIWPFQPIDTLKMGYWTNSQRNSTLRSKSTAFCLCGNPITNICGGHVGVQLQYTNMAATRTNGAYGYIALHLNLLEFEAIFHQLLEDVCRKKVLNLRFKHQFCRQ